MQLDSEYKIKEILKENGQAVFYHCKRNHDPQAVILKVLKGEFPSPDLLHIFQQEYAALRSFQADSVIKAYSLEEFHNSLAIVLESVEGVLLSTMLRKSKLTIHQFLKLAIELVSIVQEIHKNQIIHKDINPANFVVESRTGSVKIIDFSCCAKASQEQAVTLAPPKRGGALSYISPEQTGRTGQFLDYRTDFYSLGVTFYEMLCGRVPFEAGDPSELFHFIIAREPIDPVVREPDIPRTVSRIVMKLLAKNPADRYQSSFGVQADLQRCLDELLKDGHVSDFELGAGDVPRVFQVSRNFFGRIHETKMLVDWIFDPDEKATGIVMLAGYSGIGKSTLARRIGEEVMARGGLFVSGKFEQMRTDVPYAPLLQLFRELIQLVLLESNATIARWRESLLDALGANGKVITDLLPEMELIIGKQPAVPELSAAESENRFNLVLRKMVRACVEQEKRPVFFLDDMQWVDPASLRLIEMLVSDPEISMFPLGAYRSNEVSSFHPLTLFLDAMETGGVRVRTVSLGPLSVEEVGQFLGETLHRSHEEVADLAEVFLRKTDGNPFFLKQFCQLLHQEGHIYFDADLKQWRWDLEAIRKESITENVVEFMEAMLRDLPETSRNILQLAACVGPRFEVETLALVSGQSREETLLDLEKVEREGLILAEIRLLPHMEHQREVGKGGPVFGLRFFPSFRFVHDQILQTAYGLIGSGQKKMMHLMIGRLLLGKSGAQRLDKKMFQVVSHLNMGRELIVTQEERYRVAELNLQAGRLAKSSTAYSQAAVYFKTGIELLGAESWQDRYELSLALHSDNTEILYLTGQYEEMEIGFKTVLVHSGTILDKVGVYEVMMQSYKARNKLLETVNVGREVLELLGLRIPEKINKLVVLASFLKTRLRLIGRKPETLLALPEMKDPHKQAIMRILTTVGTAAYYAVPGLNPVLGFEAIHLSIRYGNSPYSAMLGYPIYGFLLCGLVGDIETGYRFGQLSLNIHRRLDNGKINPVTLYLVYNMISHWKEPVRKAIPMLKEAYLGTLDIGDLEIAANSAYGYSYRTFLVGNNLEATAEELGKYRAAIEQLGQKIPGFRQGIYQQAVANLLTPTEHPERLLGEYYHEQEMIPLHEAAHDRTTLCQLYLVKLILAYLMENLEDALDFALQADQYLENVTASLFVPTFHFYDALVRIGLYRQQRGMGQALFRRKIEKSLKKMRKWSRHAPMNYRHKYYLMRAEWERVNEQDGPAMEHYDLAVRLARENEYPQEEALSLELAARYHLDMGREDIARMYLRKAYYGYEKWGAVVKKAQLRERYSDLLAVPQRETFIHNGLSDKGFQNGFPSASLPLDMMTVMKAAQVLSDEILLDKLLKKMMQIVIESAGAQKGLLLMPGDGLWTVAARGELSDSEGIVIPDIVEEDDVAEVPETILHYVERTKKNVVLEDASGRSIYANDSYILEKRPRSVLCFPVMNQGEISCILYLENNLAPGAFTPDRLETLKLIGSQAGISLRNSLLYRKLDMTVEQLSAEVGKRKETQNQLLHAEKLAAMGRLSASIAHEFGNPLMGLKFLLSDLRNRLELREEDLRLIGVGISECDRMKFLIKNLQNFNKPTQDVRKNVDLHQVLENILLFQRKYLKTKKIEVLRQFESDLPQVHVVEDQITQVFVNLLNNAADAIPTEGGTITLATKVNSETVKVSIADTGAGISPENHKLIFEPFFSSKPDVEGTGLGLSISYGIVKDHGGVIDVSSSPGQGATFTVSLPLPGVAPGNEMIGQAGL